MSKKQELATFDGPKFGRWLHKWKEAEGLRWEEVSTKAQISKGSLAMLARGTPGRVDRNRGQTHINPSINILVRLANALELDLGYMLSKAGMSTRGHRWGNFNRHERAIFVRALRGFVNSGYNDDPLAVRLLEELSMHDVEEDGQAPPADDGQAAIASTQEAR